MRDKGKSSATATATAAPPARALLAGCCPWCGAFLMPLATAGVKWTPAHPADRFGLSSAPAEPNWSPHGPFESPWRLDSPTSRKYMVPREAAMRQAHFPSSRSGLKPPGLRPALAPLFCFYTYV